MSLQEILKNKSKEQLVESYVQIISISVLENFRDKDINPLEAEEHSDEIAAVIWEIVPKRHEYLRDSIGKAVADHILRCNAAAMVILKGITD